MRFLVPNGKIETILILPKFPLSQPDEWDKAMRPEHPEDGEKGPFAWGKVLMVLSVWGGPE